MIYIRLRIGNWVKNLLIFAPIVFSNFSISHYRLIDYILSFLSFSLLASSVYVINDYFDYSSDLKHKSRETFSKAIGQLPLKHSILSSVSLLILFLLIVFIYFGCPLAALIGIIYYFLAIIYTLKFKFIRYVDIVSIVIFYIIRVYFGGILFGIVISKWLLLYSIAVFSFLIIQKRTSELQNIQFELCRPYHRNDMSSLSSLGLFLMACSAVILFCYVHTETARLHYRNIVILKLLPFSSLLVLLLVWYQNQWRNVNENFLNLIFRSKLIFFLVVLNLSLFIFAKTGIFYV